MRQMVLAYVLIQGWTIDPYKHWFFYQPGEVLLLPTHYAEILKWGSMTRGVAVVLYGEGAFRCSLYLSQNVLDVSLKYSSSHSNLSHLNL